MNVTSPWQSAAVMPERSPINPNPFSGEDSAPDCQHKPKELVVDDSTDIAFMLLMILQNAGYDAVMSVSAVDALSLAKREHFDLIVSDIAMPEMDGYALASELRSLPDYQMVPFIAVTGFDQYDDRDRAIAAGFNTHVKKPVDPANFIELIRSLRG